MALQALLNTPLALRPAAAQALIAAAARTDAGLTLDMQARSAEAGYTVIGGVALIPVHGVLMHKLGVLQSFWGMAGYDGLRQNIWRALADRKCMRWRSISTRPAGWSRAALIWPMRFLKRAARSRSGRWWTSRHARRGMRWQAAR